MSPSILAVLAAAALHAASQPSPSSDLVVHEWGTFTSVSAADGATLDWTPLGGIDDLPCFVHRNQFNTKNGSAFGTVRMETPVLYFYAPATTAVDVRVRFRQGFITEWYPQASVPPGPSTAVRESAIAWSGVTVTPGLAERFPTEPDPSHYYAARRTQAAPVVAGGAAEKFLFYRGVGRFALPIAATASETAVASHSNQYVASDFSRTLVSVSHPAGQPIGDVIVFTHRNGKMSYEVRHRAGDDEAADPPVGGQLPVVELEQMLLAGGLYADEAAAMIDTWRDSWFEEGTRLLYIVPPSMIQTILPLQIAPTPASVTRVFVGRMELVTPSIEEEVAAALASGNLDTLREYGRFLQPIARRTVAAAASAARAMFEQRIRQATEPLPAARPPCAAPRS